MAKKTTNSQIEPVDLLALIVALFYLQSVNTVAHHTSMWVHDGSVQTVGPPAIPALLIALALSGYSWSKKQGTPSTLIVITLTVLTVASIFWISGLRANFHF